jgi:hypothetical protein
MQLRYAILNYQLFYSKLFLNFFYEVDPPEFFQSFQPLYPINNLLVVSFDNISVNNNKQHPKLRFHITSKNQPIIDSSNSDSTKVDENISSTDSSG